MIYKEFRSAVERLGFYVCVANDKAYVYSDEFEINHGRIGFVALWDDFTFSTGFSNFASIGSYKQKKILDIFYEFANTPTGDRQLYEYRVFTKKEWGNGERKIFFKDSKGTLCMEFKDVAKKKGLIHDRNEIFNGAELDKYKLTNEHLDTLSDRYVNSKYY